MSTIQVVIVTPENTIADIAADSCAIPLIDGEIGIRPGHAPTIGRLGFGELRIQHSSKTESWYVDGGFMQVANGVVSVLTGRAIPVGHLNAMEIRQRLEAAEADSSATGTEAELRRHAIAQAKAQLRILEKA